MQASARERRHFEAIRKAKLAERVERIREALRRHPLEGMREGLELGDVATSAAVEASLDRRALSQADLARRGRALRGHGNDDERRETA